MYVYICANDFTQLFSNFYYYFQIIINCLITQIGAQELQIPNLSSTLEAMMPYTERHFKRLTKLLQDLHLLTYTINRMKPDIISIDTK